MNRVLMLAIGFIVGSFVLWLGRLTVRPDPDMHKSALVIGSGCYFVVDSTPDVIEASQAGYYAGFNRALEEIEESETTYGWPGDRRDWSAYFTEIRSLTGVPNPSEYDFQHCRPGEKHAP